VEAALILKREIPPDDARFLAAVTQARIGQTLQTDLGATRAQQEEFSSLASAQSLESVTTLLTAAETLARADRATEALEWIARGVRDLVLVRIGADPDSLLNLDQLSTLKETVRNMPLDGLLDLLEDIEALQRSATRNLNLQMALETVLLRLRDALSVPAQAHST
jgi:DNA polymerase-3 subunit delta'